MRRSRKYGFYFTDRKDYDKQRWALYAKPIKRKSNGVKYSKAYNFHYTDRKDYERQKWLVRKSRQEGKEQPIAIGKLDNVLFEQSNVNEFDMSKWDKLLEDLGNYVKDKEKSNYYGDDTVQVVDLLRSSDDLDSFCRGNAIKYIIRAGKKVDLVELDLFKAIHYILIMILENEDADKQTNS